jgi:hypothetical protein
MTNRYGDTVEFIPISDTEIEFRVTQPNGEPSPYWRYGWKDEEKDTGKYNMLDPSGGPYIGEGHNMGIEDKQFEGKIVKYCTIEDNKNIIHV